MQWMNRNEMQNKSLSEDLPSFLTLLYMISKQLKRKLVQSKQIIYFSQMVISLQVYQYIIMLTRCGIKSNISMMKE